MTNERKSGRRDQRTGIGGQRQGGNGPRNRRARKNTGEVLPNASLPASSKKTAYARSCTNSGPYSRLPRSNGIGPHRTRNPPRMEPNRPHRELMPCCRSASRAAYCALYTQAARWTTPLREIAAEAGVQPIECGRSFRLRAVHPDQMRNRSFAQTRSLSPETSPGRESWRTRTLIRRRPGQRRSNTTTWAATRRGRV